MQELFTWISFFGPPLFVVLLTAWVFRPSARQYYHEAKQVIFTDVEKTHIRWHSSSRDEKLPR